MNTRLETKLLIFIAVLLTGCTSTPVKTPDKNSQYNSLEQAANLRQQGKWAAAIRTLQQGLRVHPDSTALKSTLDSLQQAWEHEKQTLYQQVLISETAALLEQQQLLNNIDENSSTDIKAKTGLLLKDIQLKGNLKALNDCVNYQSKHNLELARTCGRLANRIEQTEDSKKKYDEINNAYKQALKQSQQTRKQLSEKQLLKEAERQISKGQYLEAHELLEEILQSSPDNTRALQLFEQLDSTLKEQAEILFSVGDQLYREGKLEQAVTVWQSLLKLTPDNATVKAKIERAEHVLDKLQSLRKEQSNTQTESK